MGRGGRVVLDRVATNMDDLWSSLDFTIFDSQAAHDSRTGDQLPANQPPHSIGGADGAASLRRARQELEEAIVVDLPSSALRPPATAAVPSAASQRKYSVVDHGSSSSSSIGGVGLRPVDNIVIKTEQSGSGWQQHIKQESNADAWEPITPTTPASGSGGGRATPNSIRNHHRGGSAASSLRRTASQGAGPAAASAAAAAAMAAAAAAAAATTSAASTTPVPHNNCSRNLSNLAPTNSFNNARRNAAGSPAQLRRAITVDNSSSSSSLGPHQPLIQPQPPHNNAVITIDGSGQRSEQLGESDHLYSDFLTEIQRDWLHFRPKTPPPQTADAAAAPSAVQSPAIVGDADFGEPLVEFSEHSALQVELQRLAAESPSAMLADADGANVFLSNPFTLDDLLMDDAGASMMALPASMEIGTENSSSTDSSVHEATDLSTGAVDFDLGLGENEEAHDKLLENIIEECVLDDLKSFNTNANFWNGILEDASSGGLEADDVDLDADVDAALKKKKASKSGGNGGGKYRHGGALAQRVGSSTFSVSSMPKDEFFKKTAEPAEVAPSADGGVDAESVIEVEIVPEIKQEIVEPDSSIVAIVVPPVSMVAASIPPPLPRTIIASTSQSQVQFQQTIPMHSARSHAYLPLQQQQQHQLNNRQQQQQLQHQQQQQQQHDNINVLRHVQLATPMQLQQHNQQQHLLQQQQQQHIHRHHLSKGPSAAAGGPIVITTAMSHDSVMPHIKLEPLGEETVATSPAPATLSLAPPTTTASLKLVKSSQILPTIIKTEMGGGIPATGSIVSVAPGSNIIIQQQPIAQQQQQQMLQKKQQQQLQQQQFHQHRQQQLQQQQQQKTTYVIQHQQLTPQAALQLQQQQQHGGQHVGQLQPQQQLIATSDGGGALLLSTPTNGPADKNCEYI